MKRMEGNMCQQLTSLYRCFIFLVAMFICSKIAVVITRYVLPKQYEVFRKNPREGGSIILLIAIGIVFIVNALLLKCW